MKRPLSASYARRFSEVLERICGSRPPADLVEKWIAGDESHSYSETWIDTLQDWASMNRPFAWATGIGMIDAAEAMVAEPDPMASEED